MWAFQWLQAAHPVRSLLQQLGLAALLFFVGLSSAQAVTLEEIAAATSQGAQVNADFSMVRTLRSVQSQVTSSGSLSFLRGHGLIWRQVTPFPNVFKVTRTRLTVEIPGFTAPQVIDAEQAPAAFRYADTILSVIAVRPNDLRRYFDVTTGGTIDSWQLVLVPRSGPFVRLFSRITIAGSQGKPAQVRMQELAGDSTTVTFSNVVALARVNAADLKQLE